MQNFQQDEFAGPIAQLQRGTRNANQAMLAMQGIIPMMPQPGQALTKNVGSCRFDPFILYQDQDADQSQAQNNPGNRGQGTGARTRKIGQTRLENNGRLQWQDPKTKQWSKL